MLYVLVADNFVEILALGAAMGTLIDLSNFLAILLLGILQPTNLLLFDRISFILESFFFF